MNKFNTKTTTAWEKEILKQREKKERIRNESVFIVAIRKKYGEVSLSSEILLQLVHSLVPFYRLLHKNVA